MKIVCLACKYVIKYEDIETPSKTTFIRCPKCNIRAPFGSRFFSIDHEAKKRRKCAVCQSLLKGSGGCHICKAAINLFTNTKSTNCLICNKQTNKVIKDNGLSYSICPVCYVTLFKGYSLLDDDICNVICKAKELTQSNKILLVYAINHVLGKYTLKEGVRRSKLKLKERDGSSIDIFDMGIRISGNFRSKQ